MSIEVHAGRRSNSARESYHTYTISEHKDLGRYAIRVYGPTDEQRKQRSDHPSVLAVYSQGYLQGLDQVNAICSRYAQYANAYVVATKLPEKDLTVNDPAAFRKDVAHATVSFLQKSEHGNLPIVLSGYSWGTHPASGAAGERPNDIAGLQLIAPTWFEDEQSPSQLALRGIGDGFESLVGGSFRDRFSLIRIALHSLKEASAHPMRARSHVGSIAQSPHPEELIEKLALVRGIGVVAGRRDKICIEDGIEELAHQIKDSDPTRLVDIRKPDVSHIRIFANDSSMHEISDQLHILRQNAENSY